MVIHIAANVDASHRQLEGHSEAVAAATHRLPALALLCERRTAVIAFVVCCYFVRRRLLFVRRSGDKEASPIRMPMPAAVVGA